MTTNIEEKNSANIRYALGHAMEAAADLGVPDEMIVREVVNLALALLGAQHGGPDKLPDILERMAAEMRAAPASEVRLN